MITAIKIVLLIIGYLLIGTLCSILDSLIEGDESNIYWISLFWPFWLFMIIIAGILIFPGWFSKQILKLLRESEL